MKACESENRRILAFVIFGIFVISGACTLAICILLQPDEGWWKPYVTLLFMWVGLSILVIHEWRLPSGEFGRLFIGATIAFIAISFGLIALYLLIDIFKKNNEVSSGVYIAFVIICGGLCTVACLCIRSQTMDRKPRFSLERGKAFFSWITPATGAAGATLIVSSGLDGADVNFPSFIIVFSYAIVLFLSVSLFAHMEKSANDKLSRMGYLVGFSFSLVGVFLVPLLMSLAPSFLGGTSIWEGGLLFIVLIVLAGWQFCSVTWLWSLVDPDQPEGIVAIIIRIIARVTSSGLSWPEHKLFSLCTRQLAAIRVFNKCLLSVVAGIFALGILRSFYKKNS